METKEINKKLRNLILMQQQSEGYVSHLKSHIKSLAKTSLDVLQEKSDDIEMQEIAVSSDFALLLLESLDDAFQHINKKLKTHYLDLMNEQTKSKENGNNDNGSEAAGQGEPQA